ncbi:MAG TPA: lytic transglycosylase domain-containing protein [Methylomirabilota bacterium]|nr:lytic transglycosylase domain-containing protein [Methylomirabilota bacterium]
MAIATSAGAQVLRPAAETIVRNGPAYRHVAFAPAPSAAPRRPSPRDHGAYAREIAEAAARYAVPERLIWAVIRVESGFDHRAVSPKGARGLMQLMPETAAMLGVRDSFDPRENINGGTRHLRAMMMRFRYDLRLAVAAYNAGERPVAAYGGVPPYPETREYVAQVLRFYDAPVEWRRLPGTDIHRIVEPNGTIVYTNIPVGQLSALARGR